MGNVIVNIPIYLDEYIVGPNDSRENPLGDGGETNRDSEIESDGQALQATKLGDTYRVYPGELIEGDGALRAQLAPIVDEFE